MCGDWSSLVVGTWGPEVIGITIDNITKASTNQIAVFGQILCDIAVARPAAFGISSDSAAQ